MRRVFMLAGLAVLLALATWTYQVNNKTRALLREQRQLERQITRSAREIAHLRAEWAYLNRPARLEALAWANFGYLGLGPITAGHLNDLSDLPKVLRPKTAPVQLVEFGGVLEDTQIISARLD